MVAAMASVKLVSGQLSLHTSYPHYYPHLLPTTDPPLQIMTLDDTLPRRSTSTDFYDPGSDSTRDMSSPPSPAGSESRDHHGLHETPTKKNKRKLSEPKKRADITSKSCRQSSPAPLRQSASGQVKKMTNGHSKRSSSSKSANKSDNKSDINGTKRDISSSSSSLSNNDSDYIKDNARVSLTNIITPPFISPMFAGVPASTFGYVPSVYLAGRTFPRQGIHTSFPSIPLNLQNGFLASTGVAAGPHSSSLSIPTATTPSIYSLSVARLTGSTSETASSETPHQHDPVLNTAVQSPLSSTRPSPSPYSVLHLQPSCLHRPGSSRTVAADDDDDDASSSRAPSPEDLSIGGKMSRKHRKNYKNMTRERRVEANARERTRVHTISAAFDALRRAVPSYSHNQKLSKLAILRIASSYILALARLNDQDYTSASDHIRKPLTFTECVDICTSTIQTEGRARRRH